MDALDVRILRVMAFRPLEHAAKHPDALKAAHVARVVGATAETVRARIRAMEDGGVIVGYQAVPNLSHLGLRAGGWYLPVVDGPGKEDAVARVLDVPGLVEVHDFLGGGVCVDFTYREDELPARVRALEDAAGLPRGDGVRFYERALPPGPRALTPLDWRLVHALRERPLATPPELSDSLGVTARTVRRRLERLVQEGSVLIAPRLDPSRARGLLLVEMLFFVEDEDDAGTRARITRAFDAHRLHAYVPATRALGNFNLLLFAHSPAEVDALCRAGKAVDGVARVEAWLFKRFVDASAWLDDALSARVDEGAPE